MEILLVTLGSHGDVHPFVGLGAVLKSRGHRVTLVTNEHFAPLARQVGIDFVPIGTDDEYRRLTSDPRLWKGKQALEVVLNSLGGSMRPLYEIISARAADGNCLVVSSSLCLAARVAQDKHNFPMVTIHLSPAVFRSVIDPPKFAEVHMPKWLPRFIIRRMYAAGDRFVVDKMIGPPVNALRKELGLAPIRGIMRDWFHSPDLVIGMFPEWFAPPQPDWPVQARLTGFPMWDEKGVNAMPQALYDFLNSGEPPVVFTPGSAMFHGERFFQVAVNACARLNRRAILLSRHHEHVPKNLPKSIRHFEYAPFSELLPHVAALVHHGGIGTSAQGLAAGIRQIVMPMAHDQPDNAARLVKLGVANVIKPLQFTARRLARTIDEMISDRSYYVRCHWVSEWFKREQPLYDTAKVLENFAKSRGVGKSESLRAAV